MNNDLVKGELTPEQQQAVLQVLQDLQAKLPFLIDLTAEDRRNLPKLGDKSRAFVDQCLVAANQNEGMLPRNFDLDEYRRDVGLFKQMEPVVMAMRQFSSRVEDTFLAVGSDAYSQSLVVYQTAKLAGKDGSMNQHLEGMGKRFARKLTTPANPADGTAGAG